MYGQSSRSEALQGAFLLWKTMFLPSKFCQLLISAWCSIISIAKVKFNNNAEENTDDNQKKIPFFVLDKELIQNSGYYADILLGILHISYTYTAHRASFSF